MRTCTHTHAPVHAGGALTFPRLSSSWQDASVAWEEKEEEAEGLQASEEAGWQEKEEEAEELQASETTGWRIELVPLASGLDAEQEEVSVCARDSRWIEAGLAEEEEEEEDRLAPPQMATAFYWRVNATPRDDEQGVGGGGEGGGEEEEVRSHIAMKLVFEELPCGSQVRGYVYVYVCVRVYMMCAWTHAHSHTCIYCIYSDLDTYK